MFTVTNFTVTVWTETEELASGLDLWLSVLIRNKFPPLTRKQPHMVLHGSCYLHTVSRTWCCGRVRHQPFFKMQHHLSLSQIPFPQTFYTTKTRRQTDWVEDENGRRKNRGLCGRSGGVASKSGLQRGIFPNQSSLTASLPQERKKSQESENSGQKKSLQTK